MATRKNVPASTVRTWAKGAGIEVGKRGRLHPDHIAAFHKANPRQRYEVAGVAQQATVTVPVTTLDKAGRKRTEQRTVPTKEARAILGHPEGKRGRFSKDDLSMALSAVEADKFASKFTK